MPSSPMSAHHVKVGRKVVELQGPRPTALLHKESHKINKSPTTSSKKPVVIYMVSPEIIHVEPSEFMALVQRLTGPTSSSSQPTHGLEPSQAQRKSGDEFPVRVKARQLMAATKRSPSHSPLSPTLFLSHLSPLSDSGCIQRRNTLTSNGWLLHGDHNMVDHSGGFLDIFNHVQQ